MTQSIGQLSATTSVQTADQFAVYSSADQDTRRAPGSQVLTWLQANLTVPGATLAGQYAVPLTGTTVTVTTGDTWLIISPAGTLAALTIALPTDRTNQETVQINCSQIITALTVSGAGTTVIGAPTSLAANIFFTMQYDSVTNAWYRVR